MLLEFPEDTNAVTADIQYILGDSLLVVPLFFAEGDVKYYVPRGSWYGWSDGETRILQMVNDYNFLPLLVRLNSIIMTESGNIFIEIN